MRSDNEVIATKGKESFLILSNIGKRHNWGTLLRSAAAFGVTTVFVVGEKRALKTFGNQGTLSHLTLLSFNNFSSLREYTQSRNITICGIEICPSAIPIDTHPFHGSTAFMLGNEGLGMTERQMESCDMFVYISQYSKCTASLNVAVAGSIVLHHYAVWANIPEASRHNFKFIVAPPRSKLAAFENPTYEELFTRKAIQDKRKERNEDLKINDQETIASVSSLYM